MKILVHGLSSQRGGVESFLLDYCTRMIASSGHAFDFVLYGTGIPDYADGLQSLGCVFHTVVPRTSDPIKNRIQLSELVSSGKYDLVWFNACTLSDVSLLKAAKRCGVPCVLHSHNSSPMGNGINAFLHRLHKTGVSNLFEYGIACSDYAAEFMFPDECRLGNRCRVIPNAVECDRFRYREEQRQAIRGELGLGDSLVLGHVGRFTAQKNHAYLLKVFAEVKRTVSDARLMLLGTGPLEAHVADAARELGFGNDVIFVGSVSDAYRYYSAMDCFVFPSIYEGMPLALLEAQASGLPCVVSDAISPMSFVLKNISVLSLSVDPAKWAAAVFEGLRGDGNREWAADYLASNGYGIDESASAVLNILLQSVSSGQ